jgi:hypothetical protein
VSQSVSLVPGDLSQLVILDSVGDGMYSTGSVLNYRLDVLYDDYLYVDDRFGCAYYGKQRFASHTLIKSIRHVSWTRMTLASTRAKIVLSQCRRCLK